MSSLRNIFKHTINWCLAPLNLEIRARSFGIFLFDDLQLMIDKDSPVCLDVGANTGQTIEALSEALLNPYIYAFEPSTKTFQILRDKKYGGQIFLYNKALGRENQYREFINYDRPFLSSFLPLDVNKENRFNKDRENNREMVEINTVDQFLQQQNIDHVDLLKIDTQGFDQDVLYGAKISLSKGIIKNVLVELNFVKMYKGQSKPEEIIHFLKENGLFLVDYYEKVMLENHTLAWCTALFRKR